MIGADFSEGMLDLARAKATSADVPAGVEVRFETANALALPYPDDSSTPPRLALAPVISPISSQGWLR